MSISQQIASRSARMTFFQYRVGIRSTPAIAHALIANYARLYPSQITYLRYLQEIADEQNELHTYTEQLAA